MNYNARHSLALEQRSSIKLIDVMCRYPTQLLLYEIAIYQSTILELTINLYLTIWSTLESYFYEIDYIAINFLEITNKFGCP